MMKNFCLTAVAILFFCSNPQSILAQDNGESLKYRKWRVTFINPLSTNGVEAPDYTARYSINILGGIHGGLDGAEFGGIFNYTRQYTSGIQLAGLANLSSGNMEGLHVAGFLNGSANNLSGLQVSGFANIARGNNSGLQIAGFLNSSNKSIDGLSLAGALNASRTNVSGLQAAGIGTVAGSNVDGMTASGVLTASKESISGFTVSGVLNTSQSINGFAAAGLMNLSADMYGFQAAPFNIARNSSGFHLGVVNLAREFEGASVGLISLYGNGRKNVDIRYSDGGFTEAGINLGTYRVYNMLILGYNAFLNRDIYRVGVAVGLEKPISDVFRKWNDSSMYVNQEFTYYQHFEGDWTWRKNDIWSYKYMVGKRFASGFSLYGGPSLNMQVTRLDEAADYTWYSLWSPSGNGRDFRFWVGFTTGIRLFKQKELPSANTHW